MIVIFNLIITLALMINPAARFVPSGQTKKNLKKILLGQPLSYPLCYTIGMMKVEKGTQVQHRDNPNWKGVVVRDLDPTKPVNGVLLVHHNGRTARMHKNLLRISFHTDAKKEFGEFVG
tara:strand:+ start:367 stop:723 length:357 start_codon:yes stop_codon:yes gene_type:complete